MSNVVLIPYTPIMNYTGNSILSSQHPPQQNGQWYPSNQQSYIYMNSQNNFSQLNNGNNNIGPLPYLNPLSLSCWMYQQSMFNQNQQNNLGLLNTFHTLTNIQ